MDNSHSLGGGSMNWNLSMYCAVRVDNRLFFSNNSFNGLFFIDINTHEIIRVDSFPNENITKRNMHKKCLLIGKKVFFIPAFGNYIDVYDTENNTIDSYFLENKGNNNRIDNASDAIVIDDDVYIFPMRLDCDLRVFNTRTNEIKIIPEFKQQIRAFEFTIDSLITRTSLDKEGNIVFAILGSDVLAKWDVSSKTLYTEHVGIQNIFSVHIIGDERWVITNNTNVIYRIEGNGNIIGYSPGKTLNVDNRMYNRVLGYKSQIIVLPAYDDSVYAINENRLIEIEKLSSTVQGRNIVHSFDAHIINDDLWILPFETEECAVIGSDLMVKDRISFNFKNEHSIGNILKEMYIVQAHDGVVYEHTNMHLGDFIKVITG
jgi:hypothetical protein